MRIYDFPGFPNPFRVRVALAENNVMDQVKFVQIDVPGGEHRKEVFLALNPSGTVPALELNDGTVISECSAITEYLDFSHGEQTLTGKTAKERAVIHMMQKRMESGVLDAVGAYFHQATPGLGPDIEGEQIQEWGHRQRERALSGLAYANDVLKSSAHIAGDKFSIADITLFAGLLFADFAQIPVAEELTHLKNWRERVAKRPSIQTVLNG